MSTPEFAPIAEPLSRVRAEGVRWLWEPYLPRGKLALFDGDPGVGKSLVTLDLAARLSRGGVLPDGSPAARPHTTLLLNAEDDATDTLRPRAEAAGADLDRVVVVNDPDGGPLHFPADAAALEVLIRAHSADLVVIDPLGAFLAGASNSSDSTVRAALRPLADVARRTDCAILLVRHLRKERAAKAIHRGLGSIGLIGSVRSGWVAASHPSDPGLRVLAVTKANLARTPPALGFRLAEVADRKRATVQWTGPLAVSADELGLPVPAPLRPRDRAADWLREQLAKGPRKATELFAAAREADIPDRTLQRGKEELEAGSHRVHEAGGRQVWYWYDPSAPWPRDAPFKNPAFMSVEERLRPLF